MLVNQKKIEQETGLTYDKATKIAQGQINGYSVAVTDSFEGNQNYWNIIFAVNDTSAVNWAEVEKGSKRVRSIYVSDHKVHVVGKMAFKPYKELAETLNYMAQALAQYGLTDACASCGSAAELKAVGGKSSMPNLLCDTCASDPTIDVETKESTGKAVGKMMLGKVIGGLLKM